MGDGPSLIDLFAGAGGFSLGFMEAGFTPVLGVDNDQRAMASYAANFPSAVALVEDIEALEGEDLLDAAEIESCDVIIGGPPCAAFSVGGIRDVDDERRDLVFEFGRIVREVGARYFVMENVPGILAPPFDAVLAEFCREMENADYRVAKPWILDSSDFGVPQRRRRVFVAGAMLGLPLPIRPTQSTCARPTVKDAISDLEALETQIPDTAGEVTYVPGNESPYAERMRLDVAGGNSNATIRRVGTRLTGCARVAHSPAVKKRFKSVTHGKIDAISRFYRLHPERAAPTIRAGTLPSRGSHTAPRPIHYLFPRCITVREAARLQSLPDWFKVDSTKWRGYMQVGNAVPPLLARAVAGSLKLAMDESA
ncbi:MAG: DNA cytosine methyltransferase [Chloroflexi bacterium]|nr:DNA cytosine methyltransferase [Chloroflexota bacterium]